MDNGIHECPHYRRYMRELDAEQRHADAVERAGDEILSDVGQIVSVLQDNGIYDPGAPLFGPRGKKHATAIAGLIAQIHKARTPTADQWADLGREFHEWFIAQVDEQAEHNVEAAAESAALDRAMARAGWDE